jgi:molecular chaperone GrpE
VTDEPRPGPEAEEALPEAAEPGSFGAAAGESSDATEVEPQLEPGPDGPDPDGPDPDGLGADLSQAQTDASRAQQDVANLTADLQRLQAEYLNYKRRVDRDRDLVRENATYAALAPITEVLDTIDRAREHGPLEDGLRAVAEQLERVVSGLGLTKFGQPGDPFDPRIHEALSHVGEDPTVLVTTCRVVARSGYRIGDRVVRAAQVLVVDPALSKAERAARDERAADA